MPTFRLSVLNTPLRRPGSAKPGYFASFAHRSELRAASNTTPLVCFEAPSRPYQHGTGIESSGEDHCSSFYVLQIASQPCASSEHRNLFSSRSSSTANKLSPNKFSFDFHAANLYIFLHRDGQPQWVPTKFGKHGFLNDFL